MKKPEGRILRWISCTVTVLAVVMAVTVLVLKLSGIDPYIVMSGSMEPAIPVGSLCFVDTRIPYEKITKGDVIAYYRTENMLVTHRAAEVSDAGIITKGDNNKTADPGAVSAANYAGKTVLWIPCAGYIVRLTGSLPGRSILVLILALFAAENVFTRTGTGERPESFAKRNR